MTLPNLIVIGAMKAGTTALHDLLAQHPDVFMSEVKETDHFLDHDAADRLDGYRQHFVGATGYAIVGESSPNYTKRDAFPGVPERIVATLGPIRVIYLVRDPIERIRSHYQHHLAARGRWMSFEDAATYEGFVAPTRYASQVQPYIDLLGRAGVLLLTTEHLRDSPRDALTAIWAFLRVAPHDVEPVRRHVSTTKRMPRGGSIFQTVGKRLPERLRTRQLDGDEDISDATRSRLLEELAPEVQRLATMGVVGFDGWGLIPSDGSTPGAD